MSNTRRAGRIRNTKHVRIVIEYDEHTNEYGLTQRASSGRYEMWRHDPDLDDEFLIASGDIPPSEVSFNDVYLAAWMARWTHDHLEHDAGLRSTRRER